MANQILLSCTRYSCHQHISVLKAKIEDIEQAYELCKKGASEQFLRDTKTINAHRARVDELESVLPEKV